MLYADDACIVSQSPQVLTNMMEVAVEVCRAFALAVSAKKTEMLCMHLPRESWKMVPVEAAGQIYKPVKYSSDVPGGRRDRNPGYVRQNH